MMPALCGLLLLATSLVSPALAAPFWPYPAGSDSKSDCSKQSGTTDTSKGKSKDCDNVSSGRLSTKLKENKTATQTSDSAATKAGAKSSTASKTAEKTEKNESKKEADAITKDRMSTRGLDPAKDTPKDQTVKPDSSATPK
jgi:hypothetical protein